ncbi:peptide-methionine (S)-S-oxide reductase MsrA [Mucilaginibacter litoreus]|uniref:Peptide methionine sulfoxide reductase MsrA n=1 Tax=Mucilaginibacter litoreus TaxID=1048221 RepID=A0ABW3ANB0_9SPHI
MIRKSVTFILGVILSFSAFAGTGIKASTKPAKLDTATFATGCFWCTEAKFQQLKGVKSVTSGFTGGNVANPSYRLVCTGTTGHAEACNIVYDPAVISYDELLEAFFVAHDPTQLNRQGNDVGTQYRSAIFYHNATQKQKADYYISKLNAEKVYKNKIVTQVAPFKVFYKAEDYHQNYFNQNGSQPYCKYVIQPELEKFKKVFKNKIKTK